MRNYEQDMNHYVVQVDTTPSYKLSLETQESRTVFILTTAHEVPVLVLLERWGRCTSWQYRLTPLSSQFLPLMASCHPSWSSGFPDHTDHNITTLLDARLPAAIMSADLGAPNVIATSDDFRKLAKVVGAELNDATQEDMRSAPEQRGFVPIKTDKHKKILEHVMDQFESKVRNE